MLCNALKSPRRKREKNDRKFALKTIVVYLRHCISREKKSITQNSKDLRPKIARHCISREKKSITQNNEDLLPKIIQIIKNVKTLCFSSRKFSRDQKSPGPPLAPAVGGRWLAKPRTRTLSTHQPNHRQVRPDKSCLGIKLEPLKCKHCLGKKTTQKETYLFFLGRPGN